MLSWKPLFALGAAAVLCAACGPPQVRPESPTNCDSGNAKDCRSLCQNQQPRACYRLGWFTERGDAGVKQSGKKAVELYEKACSAKMAVACRALGVLYKNGTDDVNRSKKRSRHYFQMACDLGMSEVCPPPEAKKERSSGSSSSSSSGGLSVDVKVGE